MQWNLFMMDHYRKTEKHYIQRFYLSKSLRNNEEYSMFQSLDPFIFIPKF